MTNSVFDFKLPKNEPILTYAPGSPERAALKIELARQQSVELEIPLIIGGKEVKTGKLGKVVMPHDHQHVLATYHMVSDKEVRMAIAAAMKAKEIWSDMPWEERAKIALKAADLLAQKYRFVINAATMLGQSKNPYQAEIDSACEVIDFLRFNVYFANQIYKEQPISSDGVINKTEYRPLEGFVFTVSPFNFTAIASNLNMSPVMMGNTTVWKPATTSILSNHYLMKIFQEAGLPDGVINFLPGQGSVIGKEVFVHRDLAGIHFTGSTHTFNHFWRQLAENLPNTRTTRKSSVKQEARISLSRIPRPTWMNFAWELSGVPLSIKGKSAPRRRAPIFRKVYGQRSKPTSGICSPESRRAVSATSLTL